MKFYFKHIILTTIANLFIIGIGFSQNDACYWQQHVDYKMDINMDVNTYQYKGKQTLVYTNNSPDELDEVFYHLYFNAFQPGSQMDARLKSIKDPDGRMVDENGNSRIAALKPNEIGYIKVNTLTQNGMPVQHETVGTVLEVRLNTPIKPGEKTTLVMTFDAQVPLQIRRSGRNSKEGVALSMSQWYPKLAEYDTEGWHTSPYIAREFYGVWGNFEVNLTIDKNYIVGGTGYLQNPNEIGYGYETGTVNRPSGNTLTWRFIAPNVHDFTWAADPEYIHDTVSVPNGPMLHFLYKNNPKIIENWKRLQPATVSLMQYFSSEIGTYPYKQYSVIQGGDGGMEYAMSTLITGERSLNSLIGVTAHELAHSWFQFLLATNESKHPWMDEGFTSYISSKAENSLRKNPSDNPFKGYYESYYNLVSSGNEQPQSTHADRYNLNSAYGSSSYSKGAVFLAQLEYVIGSENVSKTLKKYFDDFAFKHPKPMDFIRIAEKVSGLELDWYLIDWTQTTNTIDYAVKAIVPLKDTTTITLERINLMPMPIDLKVTFKDGTTEMFNIPLVIMRGEKPVPKSTTVLPDWGWAYPTYSFNINTKGKVVESVEIDPLNQMADINKANNKIAL